jgi:hypothetical protein
MAAGSPVDAGGAPNGARDAAAELERRRALERERNKRFRERRKLLAAPAPAPAAPSSSSSARPPPVHGTRPLSELGSSPEDFVRAAPPVDQVVDAEPPDPEGARKFAAVVALLFRLALDDAARRYDLSAFAGELGVDVAGADQVDRVKSAAVGFVFTRAERCAIKHGFGFSVPYEDELVTLAAGAGSVVYLLAKVAGRLDRPEQPAPPKPHGQSVQPPHPFDDADSESESDFATLRVRAIDALQ